METKFLDAAGLKYAVSKIKTLIAAKQDKLTFDSKPTSGSTDRRYVCGRNGADRRAYDLA